MVAIEAANTGCEARVAAVYIDEIAVALNALRVGNMGETNQALVFHVT